MYYFVDLRRTGEGEEWEPDLPEEVDYAQIVGPRDAGWGIYHCGWLEEEILRDWPVGAVPEALGRMLESGEHYPPAPALARREMEARYCDRPCEKEVFAAEYAAAIERRLAAQRSAGYVLARAVAEQVGYLTKGVYYWMLSYVREATGPALVQWVSSDYFVYTNRAEDFELSEDDKRRLECEGDGL